MTDIVIQAALIQGHLNNAAQVFVNKILYTARSPSYNCCVVSPQSTTKIGLPSSNPPVCQSVSLWGLGFCLSSHWHVVYCKLTNINNFTNMLAIWPLPLFSYENIGSMKKNFFSKFCQLHMIKAANALLCCYFCGEYVGYTLRAFLFSWDGSDS